MIDLHRALIEALDAEQQQLIFVAQLPWTAAGNQIVGFIGDQIMAETWRWSSRDTDAEFIAATANRAQALIDLRREIAERHAPEWYQDAFYCAKCIIPKHPCEEYLAVARATLPADHPALPKTHGCLPDGTHEQGCGYGGHG